MLEVNGIKINPQHYVQKWTDWALEATPATDEEVIRNVKTLYSKANLKEPEVRVYRDYEKFLALDWASVWDSVRASVWDSVRASVWDSVRASVWDSVRDSVWDSVRESVRASVRDSVRESVRASVRESVGDSVWDSVGDSVRASVRASVWDSVRASVWDSVRASVWDSVGAWYWAEDLGFADVFVDTNVLSKEKAQELEEYKKLLETQRIAVLTQGVAYVLVAPTIRRNEQGQLHSDQRPAAEWENETGQYYLDGVSLTKEMWRKILSQKMSFKEIMAIEISDQRTVALKYNPEAVIKENAKLIDKDSRNNELYLIEGQKLNEELGHPKMYFLKMLCPTGRTFVEGVPPEEAEKLPSATAMQAYLCDLTLEEYAGMTLES